MDRSLQEVKIYYDEHIAGKLSGFVEGNERVERAWQTVERWAPGNPRRILEIGCGIGDICWRMTRRWPAVEVVGLDISARSLEIARKLFGSSRLSLVEGALVRGRLAGKFDLILLMDVYEHIALGDRPALHEALRELQSDSCRIILSFPTPHHLAWLRQNHPEQIQPVDEDVSVDTIEALARDTGTEILLYQEVGVWHVNDYAHAVLARRDGWITVAEVYPSNRNLRGKIRKLLSSAGESLIPPRSQRLGLVRQRLGRECYPDSSVGGTRSESEHHEFLNPLCLSTTLDIHIARRSILDALRLQLSDFSGTVLDIGCGYMSYKPLLMAPPSRAEKYIGLDLRGNIYQQPDLEWDGCTIPLGDNSVDCALATEVLEHCPKPKIVLGEALRVLKPGGLLFFTVPFLWPLHDVPHDEYRYTPFALERHLREAGYEQIKLKALGGWDASLAQMIGLWVRRRSMSARKRALLSKLAVPIVRYLIRRDRPPLDFGEGLMITGISGTAIKPPV